jgi:hypothetical protein
MVRVGDESALKYYILSKSYEKDSDVEHFNKSGYFYGKYMDSFKSLKDASSTNYRASDSDTTKSFFY